MNHDNFSKNVDRIAETLKDCGDCFKDYEKEFVSALMCHEDVIRLDCANVLSNIAEQIRNDDIRPKKYARGLAKLVIAAYAVAQRLDIDIDAEIMNYDEKME